jgi:tetratricopeptide (TPR) repeat protein
MRTWMMAAALVLAAPVAQAQQTSVDYAAAVEFLELSGPLEPDLRDALDVMNAARGTNFEAHDALRQLGARKPTLALIWWMNRATSTRSLRDWRRAGALAWRVDPASAVAAFEQVITKDSQDVESRLRMAWSLGSIGQKQRAAEEFAAADKIARTDLERFRAQLGLSLASPSDQADEDQGPRFDRAGRQGDQCVAR